MHRVTQREAERGERREKDASQRSEPAHTEQSNERTANSLSWSNMLTPSELCRGAVLMLLALLAGAHQAHATRHHRHRHHHRALRQAAEEWPNELNDTLALPYE